MLEIEIQWWRISLLVLAYNLTALIKDWRNVVIDPSQRPTPFRYCCYVQQAMALSHRTQNKYKTKSPL